MRTKNENVKEMGKTLGKRPFEKSRRRADNIKTDLKEIGCEVKMDVTGSGSNGVLWY
jgi:hypothetical protein